MAEYHTNWYAHGNYAKRDDPKIRLIDLYNQDRLYWKTKDGDEMLVTDMGNNHIKNSLKFLLRQEDSNQEWIEILELEIERRGI